MQDVTDNDFEAQVLQSEQPVLVDFWAPWCGPCRAVAPVVERVAQALEGAVKVVKINVDVAQQTAQRFRVSSIPTLAIFHDGTLAAQVQGALPEAQLMAFVERSVPGLGAPAMTPAQLESALKAGSVVALDLRPEADFKRRHIEGALSAPADPDHPEAFTLPPDLPAGATVVFVDKSGALSTALARRLIRAHPGQIATLGGGILEWEISGRRLVD